MGHAPQLARVPGRQGTETFELTMVTVGELRTTWQRVGCAALRGLCDGATHAIRGASVGAFELTTESGSRSTRATSGDVSACANANVRQAHPACRNLLHLFLLPIDR